MDIQHKWQECCCCAENKKPGNEYIGLRTVDMPGKCIIKIGSERFKFRVMKL